MTALEWEAVIGLEVHVQLKTASKLFCACPVEPNAEANANVCPVCLGHPGVLPVLNGEAVRFAVRLGHALNATIHTESVFARKNYVYPDLPKGYQISQYDRPICTDGRLRIDTDTGARDIRVKRVHIEEDAGKSKHEEGGEDTLVDYNRVGTPLLEIVSEPDLRAPSEASAYMMAMKAIVEYVGISSGNMEEGNLRCDANVSLRRAGDRTLGTKTELKNLNSFRHVERALAFEIERHHAILERGASVRQATLAWDEKRGETTLMRTKEDEDDYRYFPEPDLPLLRLDASLLEAERTALPELPAARRARLVTALGLKEQDAVVLTSSRALADYYEAVVALAGDATLASSWVQTEVLARADAGAPETVVSAEQLGALVRLIATGAISGAIGKRVFDAMAGTADDPEVVLDRLGLRTLSDEADITRLVEDILDRHPEQVAAFLTGKDAVRQFLFGRLMKETRGQVDPKTGQRVLAARLEARREEDACG